MVFEGLPVAKSILQFIHSEATAKFDFKEVYSKLLKDRFDDEPDEDALNAFATMSPQQRAAALAAMSPEQRAVALATMSPEQRAHLSTKGIDL